MTHLGYLYLYKIMVWVRFRVQLDVLEGMGGSARLYWDREEFGWVRWALGRFI